MTKYFAYIATVMLITACGHKTKSVDSVCQQNDTTYCDVITDSNKEIIVAESKDHRVRFISWDTHNGGTAPDIQSVCVYRADDNSVQSTTTPLLSIALGDMAYGHSVVKSLYQLDDADGETFYVAELYGEESSLIKDCILVVFCIKGTELKPRDVFNFDGKESSIYEVRYNQPTDYQEQVCMFNDKETSFSIQEVDKEMNLCEDRIRLVFDGNIFTTNNE